MKIAINCIFFIPKNGGIKEYIYNLLWALSTIDKQNNYILYVFNDYVEYAKKYLPADMLIKPVPFSSKQVIRRSLFINSFFRREEKAGNFDLFHSPFFHAPKLRKSKVVITVHDIRFFRYPSTYSFLRLLFVRFAVKNAIRKCNHIISISEFTKHELIAFAKIDERKITVIHEAVDPKNYNISKILNYQNPIQELQNAKYLLSVGHIEPRKNYERLLLAFNRLKEKEHNADLKLVIVGQKKHSYQRVIDCISHTSDVYYLDFVEEDFLFWLYSNAYLFVFPSIYEGFGFPPLEAACFGTVSAVSNVSSIPEICGDSVFYFNPFDIDNMKDVIDNLIVNPELIERKKETLTPNLSRFSWVRNAKETLNVYDVE